MRQRRRDHDRPPRYLVRIAATPAGTRVLPPSPPPMGANLRIDLTNVTADGHRVRLAVLGSARHARVVHLDGGTDSLRRRMAELLEAAGVPVTTAYSGQV